MTSEKFDPRYHPDRIFYPGSSPKGWTDEYRFVPYVRGDIFESVAAERDRLRNALHKLCCDVDGMQTEHYMMLEVLFQITGFVPWLDDEMIIKDLIRDALKQEDER